MNKKNKKELSIKLKKALEAGREANKTEKELADFTEQLFGYNWSDVDADGIIDTVSGFGSMEMSVDEFIEEMERSIRYKDKS